MEIHVNYLAVLVAAFANYVIGMIWYGALFGRAWKTLSGVSDMKFAPSGVVLGAVAALAMSYVLCHAVIFGNAYLKTGGVSGGLMCGFFNWLGFIAPVTLGVVIYEKKSWKLWMLNNAYWLVSLLVMGAILSGWK
jgi:hypothetical protein